MEESVQENGIKLMMSIDFPRKTKEGVKVKITASGGTKEEFEENLKYLKGKAFQEM